MIYLLDIAEKIDSKSLDFYYSLMPESRKKAVNLIKNESEKHQNILSYALLAYAFKENGLKCEFAVGDCGKPYDANKNMCFNISHCQKAVCCIVCEDECGIDIEQKNKGFISDDMIKKVCNDYEMKQLNHSKNKNDLFVKFWTLKESVLKMQGIGIKGDFKNALNVHCYRESLEFCDYYLSYATSKKQEIKIITLKDLNHKLNNF